MRSAHGRLSPSVLLISAKIESQRFVVEPLFGGKKWVKQNANAQKRSSQMLNTLKEAGMRISGWSFSALRILRTCKEAERNAKR